MSEQNAVSVSILERDYRVACRPGQEKQLLEAAKTLDDKMKEIRATGKVFGIERIAVMAALNVTHELLQKRPENDESSSALARLNAKLDAVLPESDIDAFDLDFND